MKASALFFDITGFFNAVNHNILSAKLAHLGVSKNTTKIISSFLQNRSTSFSFGGHTSESILILNGIPQGSPLSPILAIIYSADLLYIQKLIKNRIVSFAYMNNGVILTTSSTLETNTAVTLGALINHSTSQCNFRLIQ
jgi:hypothetical protein